jgi:hypothetical protein
MMRFWQSRPIFGRLLEACGSLLALKWLHDEPLGRRMCRIIAHDMVRPAARHLSDLLQLGRSAMCAGLRRS